MMYGNGDAYAGFSNKRMNAGILGRPKYTYGDVVRFKWNDGEKLGKVYIVDAYGTFEQNDEPSYDVRVEEERCLYKHIPESEVVELVAPAEAVGVSPEE